MVNAILAAVLSFFIPGLGQALAGDAKKGLMLFIIAILFAILSWFIFNNWVVHIIGILYSLYAAYDAYVMAK